MAGRRGSPTAARTRCPAGRRQVTLGLWTSILTNSLGADDLLRRAAVQRRVRRRRRAGQVRTRARGRTGSPDSKAKLASAHDLADLRRPRPGARLRVDADPVHHLAGAQVVQRRAVAGDHRSGCAPGRSRITSSQRTGRPVANSTGMPGRLRRTRPPRVLLADRPVGGEEGAVEVGDDQPRHLPRALARPPGIVDLQPSSRGSRVAPRATVLRLGRLTTAGLRPGRRWRPGAGLGAGRGRRAGTGLAARRRRRPGLRRRRAGLGRRRARLRGR